MFKINAFKTEKETWNVNSTSVDLETLRFQSLETCDGRALPFLESAFQVARGGILGVEPARHPRDYLGLRSAGILLPGPPPLCATAARPPQRRPPPAPACRPAEWDGRAGRAELAGRVVQALGAEWPRPGARSGTGPRPTPRRSLRGSCSLRTPAGEGGGASQDPAPASPRSCGRGSGTGRATPQVPCPARDSTSRALSSCSLAS